MKFYLFLDDDDYMYSFYRTSFNINNSTNYQLSPFLA